MMPSGQLGTSHEKLFFPNSHRMTAFAQGSSNTLLLIYLYALKSLSLHAPHKHCKPPTSVCMLAGVVAPLMTLLKSEENSVVLQAADVISHFTRGKGRTFVQAGEPLYLSATITASAQVFHSDFHSLARRTVS